MYYVNSVTNPNNNSRTIPADSFIENYFAAGGKSVVFQNIRQDFLTPILKMRAEHMRSVFLLGIHIYDSVKTFQRYVNNCLTDLFKKVKELDLANRNIEKPGSKPPSPYNLDKLPSDTLRHDFLYMWYLICLYHDVGYVFEKDSLKADEIFLESPAYPPAIPREYISACNSYYFTRKSTSLLGHKACVDHGIYGGWLLLKHLRNLHSSNLIIEKEDWCKYLLWGRPIFEHYIVNAAWTIIAHNMFLAVYGTQNACKYCFLGLDQLIYLHGFSPIKPSQNPFLFLLCLVDSIEPIKHFFGDGNIDEGKCNKIYESAEIGSSDNSFSLAMNPKKIGDKCRLSMGCQFYQDCGYCANYACHRKIADDLSFLESPEFKIKVDQRTIKCLW